MAKLSPALAKTSYDADAFEVSAKHEDFRHFQRGRGDALSTLATLAPGNEWAQGLSAMLRIDCPSFLSRADWDVVCHRVFRFGVDWADDGVQYGWTMLEMFGCNPDPSARRVDRNGIAMAIARMLSPLTVAGVDANSWHLADPRGSLMRHYRMERHGQVLMWDAYSARCGP